MGRHSRFARARIYRASDRIAEDVMARIKSDSNFAARIATELGRARQ